MGPADRTILRYDTSNGQASFLSITDNKKQESLVSQQVTISFALQLKGKQALKGELLSNLVFEACVSCGDLAVVVGFNSVFERDACDDFSKVIKTA